MIRTPQIWRRRYNYSEWKNLHENRNLDERIAQDLFRREEMIWNNNEEEERQLIAERQSKLVSQINQLDSYIFNVLNPSSNAAGSLSLDDYYDYLASGTVVEEIITEDGVYLILESGDEVGPFFLGAG